MGGGGLLQQAGDEVFLQQPDVLGKEGDEHLEGEPLGATGRGTPRLTRRLKHFARPAAASRVTADVVVVEDGLGLAGEEERQRAEVLGQVHEGDLADGESICVSKS